MSSNSYETTTPENLPSPSGSMTSFKNVSQSQETCNTSSFSDGDNAYKDDKKISVTGPSVMGTSNIVPEELTEDKNISDARTVLSVPGINNIPSSHSMNISVPNYNSVAGSSVSGINNSGFLPEAPKVISQSCQVGVVDLNADDDDEDSVAPIDNNLPELCPKLHQNDDDEDDDEDSDDDSISSNESNIELLTNIAHENVPSADSHDISKSNQRWMKFKIKSHHDFMRHTSEWMLTMNIQKVATLCTVANKFGESNFDTSIFPYRTCTIKCAVCPSISKSIRKPLCGVLVGYNMNKKEMFLAVKKIACPVNNIHQRTMNVHANLIGNFQNVIKYESELSEDEMTYLLNEAPNRTPIPSIRLHMSRIFGTRKYYTRNLLHRVLRKGRSQFLGTDLMSMKKFFEYCENVKSKGGMFKSRHCPTSLKLTAYSLQHPLEIKLVQTYGSLLFLSILLPILLNLI